VDTGVSTQTPDVKLPGDTTGMQYPLDQNGQPLTDKQRALSALNLLGVS
jgi:hypothetical protein